LAEEFNLAEEFHLAEDNSFGKSAPFFCSNARFLCFSSIFPSASWKAKTVNTLEAVEAVLQAGKEEIGVSARSLGVAR
jgi:hypothetical protein